MFGDSANEDNDHDKKPNLHLGNNKFGSVSSNSTNSSSLHGETFYDLIISSFFILNICLWMGKCKRFLTRGDKSMYQ